jgi:hypothetical protein
VSLPRPPPSCLTKFSLPPPSGLLSSFLYRQLYSIVLQNVLRNGQYTGNSQHAPPAYRTLSPASSGETFRTLLMPSETSINVVTAGIHLLNPLNIASEGSITPWYSSSDAASVVWRDSTPCRSTPHRSLSV